MLVNPRGFLQPHKKRRGHGRGGDGMRRVTGHNRSGQRGEADGIPPGRRAGHDGRISRAQSESPSAVGDNRLAVYENRIDGSGDDSGGVFDRFFLSFIRKWHLFGESKESFFRLLNNIYQIFKDNSVIKKGWLDTCRIKATLSIPYLGVLDYCIMERLKTWLARLDIPYDGELDPRAEWADLGGLTIFKESIVRKEE
jgi:hypothetical protein